MFLYLVLLRLEFRLRQAARLGVGGGLKEDERGVEKWERKMRWIRVGKEVGVRVGVGAYALLGSEDSE